MLNLKDSDALLVPQWTGGGRMMKVVYYRQHSSLLYHSLIFIVSLLHSHFITPSFPLYSTPFSSLPPSFLLSRSCCLILSFSLSLSPLLLHSVSLFLSLSLSLFLYLSCCLILPPPSLFLSFSSTDPSLSSPS